MTGVNCSSVIREPSPMSTPRTCVAPDSTAVAATPSRARAPICRMARRESWCPCGAGTSITHHLPAASERLAAARPLTERVMTHGYQLRTHRLERGAACLTCPSSPRSEAGRAATPRGPALFGGLLANSRKADDLVQERHLILMRPGQRRADHRSLTG